MKIKSNERPQPGLRRQWVRITYVSALLLAIGPLALISRAAPTTCIVPGTSPVFLTEDNSGFIWLSNQGDLYTGSLIKMSQSSCTPVQTVDLSSWIFLEAITSDGAGNVWVVGNNGGNGGAAAIAVNASTGALTGTVGVPIGAYGILYDKANNAIWVAAETGSVSKIDPATLTVVATYSTVQPGLPACASPFLMALDSQSRIWVTCDQSATLYAFNTSDGSPSLAVTLPFNSTSYPAGIVFDSVHDYIWVTNGSLFKTDLVAVDMTGTVVSASTAGDQPLGLCFDGADLWITEARPGAVWEVTPTVPPTVLKKIFDVQPTACLPMTSKSGQKSLWMTYGAPEGQGGLTHFTYK
jgi:streptogramin lyase